jgi:hypothetical protein
MLDGLRVCSCKWQESFGIILFVCVGFQYIPNSSSVLFRCIVRSRKLKQLCFSFLIVNFILVVCLLNSVSILAIFVLFRL